MSKQDVYILHGWTYSLDKWDKLKRRLKRDGYNPIMLKVPGLTVPSDEVWTLQGYVEWLRGELKNAKNPILIAHSNGGRISMAYDSTYPSHLSSLILIGPAGVYHGDALTKSRRKVFGAMARTGKKVIKSNKVRKLFYRAIGAKDYSNAKPNMRKTMKNMLEADKTLRIDLVTVPTLIINGDKDTYTPLSDAYKINSLVSDSELEIIKDGGHGIQHTCASEVYEIIKKRLES